jgi:four helix bundle protein
MLEFEVSSMTVKSYHDLIVWQKAMNLVTQIYRVTKEFPRDEIYGLTAQLRKAAVSVPSNIAEGQGRFSTREFIRFLSIAHGSLCETETQILIAERLLYIDEQVRNQLMSLSAEVGRLLHGLVRALEAKETSSTDSRCH